MVCALCVVHNRYHGHQLNFQFERSERRSVSRRSFLGGGFAGFTNFVSLKWPGIVISGIIVTGTIAGLQQVAVVASQFGENFSQCSCINDSKHDALYKTFAARRPLDFWI